MLYSELLGLTDGQATYEQYLEIEKAYMVKEKMTQRQAAALWKRRYGPKVEKPLPEYMRMFKQAIRDLWNEHEYAVSYTNKISDKHKARMEQYKADNADMPEWFVNEAIERMEKERVRTMFDIWQDFGNDASFHIIYADGSEDFASGVEIVGHDVKLKMQHIVYAYYLDGYVGYDTLTGELEWDEQEGDETGDEWFERRDAYMSMVQYKYGTEWAKRMIEKYGEGVATA